MGTDFIIDKLTSSKIYGMSRNGQEIEMSIDFSDDGAYLSFLQTITGSTLTLEAKFTKLTIREIINQTDDFNAEPSEELNTFLEQFVKE